jgi:uncharacterized membrane protein
MEDNKKAFEPLQAIGLFWGCFGIMVLLGIFFSETNLGKLTNGICGTILLLSGVGAFLKGNYNKKKNSQS